MTTMLPRTEVLTEEMLARFDERAPHYDRENRFFHEDFDELRDAGYLQPGRSRPSTAAPACRSPRSAGCSGAWPTTRRRPRSR